MLSANLPSYWAAAHRRETPLVTADGVKHEVKLLFGPVWDKGIHKVAGCANPPAGSEKSIVVHAVIPC